jgi:Holliday junction resolvasome RuvABC endonuclease subunit
MTQDAVRMMGLDLSLTGTGLARPDGLTTRIVTKPTADKLHGDIMRCRHIALTIRKEIADTGTTHVVVEGSVHRSPAAFDTGQLTGIVKLMLLEGDIPWVDIPPAALKRFAAHNGNASKDMMMAHAIRDFGFEGSNNDEADAFLLWQMGETALGRRPKTNKERLGIVSAIVWPWGGAGSK